MRVEGGSKVISQSPEREVHRNELAAAAAAAPKGFDRKQMTLTYGPIKTWDIVSRYRLLLIIIIN